MPVPPAHADMNSVAATRRASQISLASFLVRRFEPASMIPKRPSPWSCIIHTAYTGRLCAGASGISSAEAAVVCTVRVTLAGLEPGVTELGDTPQVVFAGAPLQLSLTA